MQICVASGPDTPFHNYAYTQTRWSNFLTPPAYASRFDRTRGCARYGLWCVCMFLRRFTPLGTLDACPACREGALGQEQHTRIRT